MGVRNNRTAGGARGSHVLPCGDIDRSRHIGPDLLTHVKNGAWRGRSTKDGFISTNEDLDVDRVKGERDAITCEISSQR